MKIKEKNPSQFGFLCQTRLDFGEIFISHQHAYVNNELVLMNWWLSAALAFKWKHWQGPEMTKAALVN